MELWCYDKNTKTGVIQLIKTRAHQLVGLEGFQHTGFPEMVTSIDLNCPLDRQYVLRMPIKVDGGNFEIPNQLDWLSQFIETAKRHQEKLGVDHPFCYVTVRHGMVTSQSDDEWHVDGFSTKVPHRPEQNYVWADCDGTEFAEVNVEFPTGFNPRIHNVNRYLEKHLGKVEKAKDRVMYCMDPYLVHRRPRGSQGKMRTFVRVSFVPIEINDINNTQNPLLPRSYTMDGVAFRNTLKDW